MTTAWPDGPEALDAEQRRLAALAPDLWRPPLAEGTEVPAVPPGSGDVLPRSGDVAAGSGGVPPASGALAPGSGLVAPQSGAVVAGRRLRVGGVFLAYGTGQQGPGHAGDPGWAGAAVVEVPGHAVLACAVVAVPAGAPYDAGRLALREGPALAAAVAALAVAPDVVLVDATGGDHPRRAGLALHLGAVADVPTVGVTHRPLLATGDWPPEEAGAAAPLRLGDEVVGAWLRTTATARPLAVHAAWRTDVETAVEVVRRSVGTARTPEPLRQARVAARTARARAEGRAR